MGGPIAAGGSPGKCGPVSVLQLEAAALNAAQPPERLLYDGWWLHFSPGRARRARSVQALACGELPLDEKLTEVTRFYRARGLDPLLRVTPTSMPSGLDEDLQACGWQLIERSCVMSRAMDREEVAADSPHFESVDIARFAAAIGELRGDGPAEMAALQMRLLASPLRESSLRVVAIEGGRAAAAGQVIVDRGLAGLYDIVVAAHARGRGLGGALVRRLHAWADARAHTAYLQVAEDNAQARRLYARLGFTDCYSYWYRRPPTVAG